MERSSAIVARLLRLRHPIAATLLLTLVMGAIPLAAAALFPRETPLAAATTYLAFHNVVEFFSVMVALSIFGVGWYTHDLTRDRHALLLASAFLAVGIIAHALSYPGMPDLVTASSANKASTLWVAARFLGAIAFLASAFVRPGSAPRWLTRPALGTAAVAVAGAVLAAVLFFPERGRELASRIRELRPGLPVLFTSGYVDPGFSIDDLGDESGFLQKPFTATALLEALDALLHQEPARAAAGSEA